MSILLARRVFGQGTGGIITPPPVETETLIDYNPGIYGMVESFNPTIGTYNNYLDDSVNGFKGFPPTDFLGVLVPLTWGRVETGFNVFDIPYCLSLVEAGKTRGLRTIFMIMDQSYGGGANSTYLPTYLGTLAGAQGGWVLKPPAGTMGMSPRRYNSVVTARKLALAQALAGNGPGEGGLNAHPYFEGLQWCPETELGLTTSIDPLYTEAGYVAEMRNFLLGLRAIFTRKNLWIGFNSGFTASVHWNNLIAHCIESKIGSQPPDFRPTDYPPAETVVANYGNTADAYLYGYGNGSFDVRDIMLMGSRFEDPDSAKYGEPWKLDLLYKGMYGAWYYSKTIRKDRHLIYSRKNYQFRPDTFGPDVQAYWNRSDLQPKAHQRVRDFLLAGGHPMHIPAPTYYNGKYITGRIV